MIEMVGLVDSLFQERETLTRRRTNPDVPSVGRKTKSM